MREEDVLILLTATVTPNTGVTTYFYMNPAERREQYRQAICYYLKHTTAKIVFAENSGCDLAKDFIDIPADRLEFIVWNELPNGHPNKGYNEMKILERVWDESALIKSCSCVIKITGRLICKNIKKVISSLPSNTDLSVTINRKHTYTDSRIFALSPRVGGCLFQYRERLNSLVGFEDILLLMIDNLPPKHKFVYMPVYCNMSGVEAGRGISYNVGGVKLLRDKIKHQIKRLSFYLYTLQHK